MLKNIDELAGLISEEINKGRKTDVINILRSDYYGVINALTYADSLQKGKIPLEMRESVLVAICKELGISDLEYYFSKEDIELGEILRRLNVLEQDKVKLFKEVEILKGKR